MASIGSGDIKAQVEDWKSISLTSFQALGRAMKGMIAVAEDLGPDETLLAITSGDFANEPGLLVLTNQRLVFARGRILGAVSQTAVSLDQIEAASVQATAVGLPSLHVRRGGQDMVFARVDRAQDFAARLQDAMGEAKTARYAPRRSDISDASLASAAGAPIIGDDLVSQLERLGALRDKGVISEREFKDLKGRLLGM